MLTSLDFLNVGEQWLPKDEDTRKRLHKYNRNKDLFENRHGNLDSYQEAFKRIERVIGNFDDVISYATIINYHRLVSKKTADLLYGESPIIVSENKQLLDEITEKTNMYMKLYQNAIDISRFGDGILFLYNNNGYGNFEAISPRLWIPVINPFNQNDILNHVIAWEVKEGKNEYLMLQIHYKGYYEKRIHKLDKIDDYNIKMYSSTSNKVIGELIEAETIQTGLSDFAIIHTTNLTTSDCMTGIDDYEDIDDIIRNLLVRISQIDKILDKHASPSVSGPSFALEQDPASGEWKLKMGNYFPRDSKEDAEVNYVTWDGKLDSSFQQIELFINQLYIISEMGQILLGGQDKGGTNLSGRALKFKMISPLAKIKRLTMFLDNKVKKLIRLLSEMYVGELGESISITWQDGLPNDPLEEADIIEKRTGGMATMSRRRAIMQYDQLDEEAADEELERIAEEETASNPIIESQFNLRDDLNDG